MSQPAETEIKDPIVCAAKHYWILRPNLKGTAALVCKYVKPLEDVEIQETDLVKEVPPKALHSLATVDSLARLAPALPPGVSSLSNGVTFRQLQTKTGVSVFLAAKELIRNKIEYQRSRPIRRVFQSNPAAFNVPLGELKPAHDHQTLNNEVFSLAPSTIGLTDASTGFEDMAAYTDGRDELLRRLGTSILSFESVVQDDSCWTGAKSGTGDAISKEQDRRAIMADTIGKVIHLEKKDMGPGLWLTTATPPLDSNRTSTASASSRNSSIVSDILEQYF